jgi:hypothetical protein
VKFVPAAPQSAKLPSSAMVLLTTGAGTLGLSHRSARATPMMPTPTTAPARAMLAFVLA